MGILELKAEFEAERSIDDATDYRDFDEINGLYDEVTL